MHYMYVSAIGMSDNIALVMSARPTNVNGLIGYGLEPRLRIVSKNLVLFIKYYLLLLYPIGNISFLKSENYHITNLFLSLIGRRVINGLTLTIVLTKVFPVCVYVCMCISRAHKKTRV